MLTNDRLELIHLRAIVAITREVLSMHPVPDFKTWAADMSAAGWYFHTLRGEWANDKSGETVYISTGEAVALYADGETPNQKRLIGVTS